MSEAVATAGLAPAVKGKAGKAAPKKLMKFRVLFGKHLETTDVLDEAGEPVLDHKRVPVKHTKVHRAATLRDPNADDVIVTTRDLCAIFNRPPGPDKFARLHDDAPTPVRVRDDFDNMTVPALIAFAEDEGIDLSKVVPDKKNVAKNVKPQLLALIRGHVPERVGD